MASEDEQLRELAARATANDSKMQRWLVGRQKSSDAEFEVIRAESAEIAAAAAAITMAQLKRLRDAARIEPHPRMSMDKLAAALRQAMKWRRDESCYIVDDIRMLPKLVVVACWDDGDHIHFIIHVIAGEQDGYLGYCYEDDPTRWSWSSSEVEVREVAELSGMWFYGENLVPKIKGAEPDRIFWQDPVPQVPLPRTIHEVKSLNPDAGRWLNPDYT